MIIINNSSTYYSCLKKPAVRNKILFFQIVSNLKHNLKNAFHYMLNKCFNKKFKNL